VSTPVDPVDPVNPVNPADPAARRVARLLRWYPQSWRARYGAEFAELLLAEFAEQPRSWRRGVDVACHGLLARLADAGLTSRIQPPEQSLATVGCALATFGVLAIAMLAQLAMGWQWVSPGSSSVTGATLVMTLAAACIGLIGLAAAVPVIWRVLVTAARRDWRMIRPAGLALGCAVALALGAKHFQNSWPGTGGTGAEHGLVPGGVAAFGWASTLSVTSFWAHPGLLGRFPAAELAWMALSPLAGIVLAGAVVMVVRRLSLPGRMVGYLARLAQGACTAAAAFAAGAAMWMLGRVPPAGLFRPGLVDGAELLTMMVALTLALAASRSLCAVRPRQAARCKSGVKTRSAGVKKV
jgi:hypothetical protein